MADILIIGELLAEIMADEIGQRFDTPGGTFRGPYASGAPGIFIDQVAKTGASGSIVACVGNDGFGRLILSRLAGDGVDISRVKISDALPTGTAFITYRHDGSREYIFNIVNSAASLLDESMIDAAWARGCKYFHVMGSYLAVEKSRSLIFKALDLVETAGGKISFDPNIRPELLSFAGTKQALFDVLRRCSVFLPSEPDIEPLFGTKDFKTCGQNLFENPKLEMIVLKKAANGAVYYDRERSLHASAFKVIEVDPTGAGDTFCAALLACLVKKIEISKALDIACAAGALAVSKRGPMEGTATMNEIEAFMKNAERLG